MADGSERPEDHEESLEEFREGLQEKSAEEHEHGKPEAEAEPHPETKKDEPDSLDQLRDEVAGKYLEEPER